MLADNSFSPLDEGWRDAAGLTSASHPTRLTPAIIGSEALLQ